MMDGARTANAVLFREMVEASFCMRIYFLPKQNQNSLFAEKSQNQNMNFADVSIFSQGDRIFSQGDRFSCWRWSTLTTMSNDMSWMPGPLGSYMNMVT
jgi:hypothetical protein